MPVGTAPSGGFFSRMMGQMPGMINSLGGKYGGDMAGAARASSALLGRQRPSLPRTPKVTSGIPAGQMPGQQMPMPSMPEGINTGPTLNASMPMRGSGSGFWNPMGKQLEFNGQPIGQPMQDNSGMGGIFSRYRTMSGPGQTPFGMRF